MLPLKLTSREQSALAEICSVLRRWLYEEIVSPPMKAEDLRERIATVLERFELTPQQLDALYDRLHRTGSNS